MKAFIAVLLLATASLTGCRWIDDAVKEYAEPITKAQIEEAIKPFANRIAASTAAADRANEESMRLRSEFALLRTELSELKKSVESLEWNDKSYRNEYKEETATLSAESTGYGVARTKLGPAIVTLEKVEPYLDGFKIKLWITVLAPIELSGLKGTISWFETDPEVRKKNNHWVREKEFTSLSQFVGGRYTEVEVILTPASAAGVKEFWVSLKTDQISVARPVGAPPRNR